MKDLLQVANDIKNLYEEIILIDQKNKEAKKRLDEKNETFKKNINTNQKLNKEITNTSFDELIISAKSNPITNHKINNLDSLYQQKYCLYLIKIISQTKDDIRKKEQMLFLIRILSSIKNPSFKISQILRESKKDINIWEVTKFIKNDFINLFIVDSVIITYIDGCAEEKSKEILSEFISSFDLDYNCISKLFELSKSILNEENDKIITYSRINNTDFFNCYLKSIIPFSEKESCIENSDKIRNYEIIPKKNNLEDDFLENIKKEVNKLTFNLENKNSISDVNIKEISTDNNDLDTKNFINDIYDNNCNIKNFNLEIKNEEYNTLTIESKDEEEILIYSLDELSKCTNNVNVILINYSFDDVEKIDLNKYYPKNITFKNCTFKNMEGFYCSNNTNNEYKKIKFLDCIFDDCITSNYFIEIQNCDIINCKFNNFKKSSIPNEKMSNSIKSFIFINEGNILNCTFNNFNSENIKSYFLINIINGDISNSNFEECETNLNIINIFNGEINDCNFTNCTSSNIIKGGIKYQMFKREISKVIIKNCNFTNCSTQYTVKTKVFEEMISLSSQSIFENCTFKKCTTTSGEYIRTYY